MLKVFAVFDQKASAYLAPFFMPATGMALRAFADTVNDPKTSMYRHPGDFELFELGTFDPSSGRVEAKDNPEYLIRALDVKEEVEDNQLSLLSEDGNNA